MSSSNHPPAASVPERGFAGGSLRGSSSEGPVPACEVRYRALFDEAVEGILLVNPEGTVIEVNRAFARMHGYDAPAEMVGMTLAQLDTPDQGPLVEERMRRLAAGEVLTFEVEHRRKDGTTFPLSVTASRVGVGGTWYLQAFHRDISEQRRNQRLRALSAEIFRILNDRQALPDVIRRILEVVQRDTGIEAVALRLRKDKDFPYAASVGFSAGFLSAENQLAVRTSSGEFCLDELGNVRLECTCGLVIAGKTDPGNPLFTAGGSAWTNDSAEVLNLPADQDPRLHPRNRCVHAGFRSVALVPIRVEGKIVGLLQLNDHRPGCFTPDLVRYFEGLASSFGVALWRVKEDQAARDSRRQLMEAQQIARMGSWVFDHVEDSLEWSDEVFRIYEVDPPSFRLTYPAFLELVHPEDRDRVDLAFRHSLETRTAFENEHRVRCSDGRVKYVHARCRTDYDPDGRPVRSMGSVQDITERKQAELEARRQDERLRLALEAAGMVTWELDIASGRLVYSSNLPTLAGVPDVSRYLTLESFVEQLHPEDREVTRSAILRMVGSGEPFQCEYRVRLPDGSWHWLAGKGSCVVGPDGRPVSVLGVSQDITERRRAERMVVAEAARRRALIESSRDGIVVLDVNGKVVEANRRFAEMLGYSAEEVLQLHVWDWDRDWARERVLEEIRRIGPEGAHFGTRHWRKDGTFFDVELSNSVVDLEGQRMVFCVCHDVTDRNLAEARLRESLLFRREAEKIARIGAWKVSPATDFLYWTEGVYEIIEAPLDYRPGLREGLSLYDRESVPRLEAALQAALRDGTPFALEIGLTTLRGRHIWTEVRGLVRIEEGGQPLIVGTFQDITEQRQAVEALAAREEVFSAIVGQAMDAIAVVDGQTGRFVEFNTLAHEGLGYSREDFSHFGVQDIQAEHSVREIFATLENVRQRGSVVFESRHRHRDGSLRDVRVSARTLNLRGRDFVASVWTDITDRKRAEARLARESLRIRFLLELHQRAQQLTDRELYDYVLDESVRLTDCAFAFFHQVSEDQTTILQTAIRPDNGRVRGSTVGAYPVAEAGRWADCIREGRPILDNAGVDSRVLTTITKRGVVASRGILSLPVIQDGKVRIVVGVGGRAEAFTEDDATHLQVVANELHKILMQRAAQNQLRQLSRAVEQSPVSVVITDPHGRIEYVNPWFTRVSGYTPEEVLGKNPRVLKSGEQDAAHYRQLWQTVLSGRAWHGEFRNRKKNGDLHWESASISPITDPTGKITHFVAVKEDITERKQLEAQVRESSKLEAVGQLAGGVAHDFNNILAAIMMHLGLMQTNPGLDAETLQSLRELEEEAQRAASLTRQLLMFSRRSVLAIRPQDMNEIVGNLLKMLTRLIGENIRLRFEGDSRLPAVEADAGMMEQILMNLVVNARDAMPRGGSITIATAVVDFTSSTAAASPFPDRRPGRFVCLSVADTGVGMDEATRKRIFEPFFTTKEPGKGTGLGLATVHGIVAQHRGWVEVESTVGRGTTFRVCLPARADTAGAPETITSSTPLRRGKETILVVEDESKVRQLLCRTLRALGYHVYETENGQEAMALWQKCGATVDLLFTDMVMPEGLTGLELTQRLRALKPDLKVIISSGYSAEIVQAGLPTEAGIFYLPKPYADKTLAEVVRNCLEGKS